MKETGNKERIITILSKFESGLTYKSLLERYKEIYNENLENGYVYLKRLKENGVIEVYKTPNIKGKNLTYRLKSEHKESQDNNIIEQLERKIEKLKEKLGSLHLIMDKRMDFTEEPTENEKEEIKEIEMIIQ